MHIKPIPIEYNINRFIGVDLIVINHVDDYNTRFLDVELKQNKEKIDLTGSTAKASFVVLENKNRFLLNSDVPCEITEEGNLLIPIDSRVIPKRAGTLLIEAAVTDADGNVFTLPFPLRVKLKGSVIDDAALTPESQGTVAGILKDLLENAVREENVNELIDEFAGTITIKNNRLVYLDGSGEERIIGVLPGSVPGADGKSAYAVAVENGFSGTEEQWLESLKGEQGEKGDKGAPGENGKDGNSIWRTVNSPSAPSYPDKPGYGFNVADLMGGDRDVQVGDVVFYGDYYSVINQIIGTVAYSDTRRSLKGSKGDKGDSYVLTDADKQEIARLVIELLNETGE